MGAVEANPLFPIGELARRTGVSVRTIRFWSDAGVVPPSGRSPADYCLYDVHAQARLEAARTRRELGIDLDSITRLLDREISLGDVAALHAYALDVQIRILRLRRSVLRAVAKRDTTATSTRRRPRPPPCLSPSSTPCAPAPASLTLPDCAVRSPTASPPAPTPASSATGISSASSTAGSRLALARRLQVDHRGPAVAPRLDVRG